MKLRFRKLGPERAVGVYAGRVLWHSQVGWNISLNLWWWTLELEWWYDLPA